MKCDVLKLSLQISFQGFGVNAAMLSNTNTHTQTPTHAHRPLPSFAQGSKISQHKGSACLSVSSGTLRPPPARQTTTADATTHIFNKSLMCPESTDCSVTWQKLASSRPEKIRLTVYRLNTSSTQRKMLKKFHLLIGKESDLWPKINMNVHSKPQNDKLKIEFFSFSY